MKSKKLNDIFGELKRNPPKILAKTRKKKGKAAADRQRIAIGLSKAAKRDALKWMR